MKITMKYTLFLRVIVAVVLVAFWGYVSETLSINPSLTLAIIPVSLGMLTVITVVIQLFLKEEVQARMKKLLDIEMENRRKVLIINLNALVSYLEGEKSPSYSESGAEGLESEFQKFDSIKSKYTIQPKIVYSTILILLSSLILIIFWTNPQFFTGDVTFYFNIIEPRQYTTKLGLAHVGIGILVIGLWMVLKILFNSLETEFWKKNR